MLEMNNITEFTNSSIVMNPTKGGSSDDLVEQYLGELSCDVVYQIYKRYLPDFVFFDYSIWGMMHWVDGGRGCSGSGYQG